VNCPLLAVPCPIRGRQSRLRLLQSERFIGRF
jgi:hypothetical protein